MFNTSAVRSLAGLLVLGAYAATALALIEMGVYGIALFIAMPIVLGAISGWVVQPGTARGAAGIGALSVIAGLALLVLIKVEGLVCVVMAIPLAVPLGAFGGFITYRSAAPGTAMMLLMVPAGFTWDMNALPEVFEVRTRIEIAAPPERVWQHVVTFAELPPPDDWLFKTGLAYPKRARIEGSGVGAVRYCEFSTGPFVEPIEIWDEPRLLRFSVTENPAPMHEWSPFGPIFPKHLEGYMVSKRGQFRLTPSGGGRTLLEGTTWYQHGLWPSTYWRWWSDAIIHRIHLRVLNHVKTLSEAAL